MDIPDEARIAELETALDMATEILREDRDVLQLRVIELEAKRAESERVQRDAVARAAQVAILGQLSDVLLKQRDGLEISSATTRMRRLGLEEAAGIARSLAKTLEAGAGQTGVRDVR